VLNGPDPSVSAHDTPLVTFQASVEEPPTSIVAGVAVNEVIVVSTHMFVVVSHPHAPDAHTVQSLFAVHPHTPLTHTVPAALPAQGAHASPGFPHAVGSLVPATHVPLLLQQPPLQTGFVEQSAEHLPFSHAWFDPHWLESVQPHALEMHAWPFVLFVQSAHVSPAPPQLPGWVSSVAQDPPVVQHVPLHGFTVQSDPHLPPVPHAEPLRHCALLLQPHVPPPVTARHAVPLTFAEHEPHAVPPVPHADGEESPPVHVGVACVVSQQPPLQGFTEQSDPHLPFVPHAEPTGQSLAWVHPHAVPVQM